MELVHPIPGARISQRFGEHPEYYAKLRYPGGHPGTDFAAPLPKDYAQWHGTSVHLLAAGRVYRGFDPAGYGLYAYAIGPTGEWVYGHLSELLLVDGTFVLAGGCLGRVGYSGNTNPPGIRGTHVHIGWRPPGYQVDDPYRGYRDFLEFLPQEPV